MKRNFFKDFSRFAKLCGKESRMLFTIAFLEGIISGALGTIFQAQALKYIIAYFIDKQSNALANAFIMIVLTVLVGFVFRPVLDYFGNVIVSKIIASLRIRLYEHLTKLPASYFAGTHSGDIAARINGDVDAFAGACYTIRSFIESIIPAIVLMPYLLVLDIRMALIIGLVGLAFLILTAKVIEPLRIRQKKIRSEIAKMSVSATDGIMGFQVIKSNNLEEKFSNSFKEHAGTLLNTERDFARVNAIVGFFNIFTWCAGEAFIAIFGLVFVLKSTLAVTNLAALVSAGRSVIGIFTDFSSLPVQLQQAFAGVDRVQELCDIEPEPERYPISGNFEDCGISVKNLSFSYNKETKVLNNISINAKRGKTIALVGDSGSGKTTLIKILAGIYCADEGEITVLGRPLGDYTLDEYRKKIAYVPQNAYIFDGSIEENISYGREGASLNEIKLAAQKSNAELFILQKPAQYDTPVGERGIKLSGGERQRIAIARAILKNSEILLLDEATSSLDSESELAIQETLDSLIQQHTSVVVAHRLSTIINADCIYMMQKGKIIGFGKHEQLLDSCIKYRELYYRLFASKEGQSK
ncbi:MAG TPA: ABC transporter ATP-binding protein [Clostridia bacterium]|nr:ABC transporter ATP-binding protein [Clostridiaceae bacterium]HOF26957.1 ABC transporter ATP-binding protein [Clostridia bacterium]HOR90354.1 ABC transporter ATP-binding protein [Clostridia bacterium]HOT71619.1 ABC transporter ATP-binding protein [Clostridia bacterium]HPL08887.1 ABC transporter ATP-binding protein [Clostridia bacterium]